MMMMMRKWDEETLKGVFLHLQVPADLGRCMLVCKQWRHILTKDGYVWRCLIARQWPSVSRSDHMTTSLLKRIYGTFNKIDYFIRTYKPKFIPKSSVSDYKFYLDIWNGEDGSLILSKVIQASSLSRNRAYSIPSPGVSDPLVESHLERSRYSVPGVSDHLVDYKLIAPLEPRLTIPRPRSVNVSLLVGREHDETACIIHKSATHAVLPQTCFAVAFNDLDFCRNIIIVPHVQAWLCMYFMDDDIHDEEVDFFGIELGFSDVPVHNFKPVPLTNTYTDRKHDWYELGKAVVRTLDEDSFLCLLDSLDWKRGNQKVSGRESSQIGEFERESCEEVVDLVFPFLEGNDLAKCLLVSKQWRDVGEDEYFWKCLCAKGWPSVYNEVMLQNAITYRHMFGKYCMKPPHFSGAFELPPATFDFSDVELYVDIFEGSSFEGRHAYSKAINWADLLLGGIDTTAPGVCDAVKAHLESSELKTTIPIEPRFSIVKDFINVSLLVVRKDINKVAALLRPDSLLTLTDLNQRRYFVREFLKFSADYPLAPYIRIYFSLLCTNLKEDDGKVVDVFGDGKVVDVFGAELDFYDSGDAYNSKEQLMCLLHMLDWK